MNMADMVQAIYTKVATTKDFKLLKSSVDLYSNQNPTRTIDCTNIPDYQSKTADNFILIPKYYSLCNTQTSTGIRNCTDKTDAQKTYNPDSGILTLKDFCRFFASVNICVGLGIVADIYYY